MNALTQIGEALSMAKHLTCAIMRCEVNAQYHWATLIQLDALARGAKGPEQNDARRLMDNQDLLPSGKSATQRTLAALADDCHNTQMDAMTNWTPIALVKSKAPMGVVVEFGDEVVLTAEDPIEEARR